MDKHEAIHIAELLGELALGIAAYAFLPPPLNTLAIAVLIELMKVVNDAT